MKEVWRRDGLQAEPGREVKVGKLKSAASKRTVPLNDTAIAMIQDLRKETYFGEDTPLVPGEHGNFTRPVNFRKRYYRILAAAGIEKKGLHSLRHPYVKPTKKIYNFFCSFSGSFIAAHSCFKWVFTVILPFRIP